MSGTVFKSTSRGFIPPGFGVYIHIPFCVRKCPYCDFNSYGVGTGEPELAAPYTEAVCRELTTLLESAAFRGRTVESIFFGGGTPSLLSAAKIKSIFDTIRSHAPIAPDAEITLEANPGTVLEALGREKLADLRQIGINRVSFGGQSFSPRKLELLGRIHKPEEIGEAIANARAGGFDQINCDLIFGVKGERLEEWKSDLEQLTALKPEHISAYGLTIEPGTEFGRMARQGLRMDEDDEVQAEFFEQTQSVLEGQGYLQYEVSNFAPSGNESRHNINYWRRGEYAGAGAGAHGFARSEEHPWGRRTMNLPRPEHYIERVRAAGKGEHTAEVLTREQAELEFLSLGLRTKEGVSSERFEESFGRRIFGGDLSEVERFELDGLMECREGRMRMTKRGLLFLNTVVERLAQCLLVLIAVCASFHGGMSQAAEPKPKIGAILPLTGELAHFGKPIQEGMELAVKELGAEGFSVLYEDDQSMNRTAALSGATRLVNVEKVSAVVNIAVNSMSAISPMLNRAKVPGIVVWDSNRLLLAQGDYIFGFGYATELAGEDLADYAYSKLGLRNIAIIANNDEWSELITASFKSRFEKLGGKLPMAEQVNVDSSDLRTLILRAKQLKVDGMYAPMIGRSLTSWISQSKELKFEGVRLSGDGLGEDELKQAGEANSEGIVATQIYLQNPEFEKRYRAAFAGADSAVRLGFVGLGYDVIDCLAKLRKKAGAESFTGEKVRALLESSLCQGVTGVTDFSKGKISTKREPILRVKGGKLIPVE